MTVFKSTDGVVVGQPISPFFGAQNGVQGAGAPVVQAPISTANQATPVLDSVSRGSLPHNALVNTVNGVSVGGNPAGIGYDPCSVMELLSSGNGNQANGGVGMGAVQNEQGENQQVTVTLSAPAMIANGPTPVNVDPIGLAPCPGTIPTTALGLAAGSFSG